MRRLWALFLLPLRLVAALVRLLERLGLAVLGAFAFAAGLIAVLALLFAWHVSPATPTVLPERFVLEVAPKGALTESPPFAPLPLETAPPHFGTLVEALTAAIDDPRVVGVALDLTEFGSASYAQIDELRGVLARLRATGKPVWAFAEQFDQKRYLLASAASEITLDPAGHLLLTGLAIEPTYLKAALERLGITIYAFRAGRYKSFVEPFTRTAMSEEERVAMGDLVQGLWQQITWAIAEARQLPREAIERYHRHFDERLAAHAGDPAATALAERLVDRLEPRTAWRKRLEAMAQLTDSPRAFVAWERYAVERPDAISLPALTHRGTIRVIALTGALTDAEEEEEGTGVAAAIEALTSAQKEPSVRAVVLRIDSPGGSAFAAERLRRAVAEVRAAGKPVIASLAGVAASGGYWVAAASDAVVAAPQTVTGSIGVFALIPNAAGLLRDWSLTTDGVRTGPFAAPLDPRQPLPEPVARALQLSVEHTYRRFLQVVREGRKLPEAEVQPVAEGRVWLGSAAVKLGLVDRLGGVMSAVALARERANAPEAAIEWHTPTPSPRQLVRRLLLALGIPAGEELKFAAAAAGLSQTPEAAAHRRLEVAALVHLARVEPASAARLPPLYPFLFFASQRASSWATWAHCLCTAP